MKRGETAKIALILWYFSESYKFIATDPQTRYINPENSHKLLLKSNQTLLPALSIITLRTPKISAIGAITSQKIPRFLTDFFFISSNHISCRNECGQDYYWIGRLFASCEQIVMNNLAKK